MTARSAPTGDRLVLQRRGSPGQLPRRRRRDLGVDLVGRDLQQRLVDRDVVALGLQPARDRPFGDRFAQRGHGDRGAALDLAGRRGSRRRLGGGRGLGGRRLRAPLGRCGRLLDRLRRGGRCRLRGGLFGRGRCRDGLLVRCGRRLGAVTDHGEVGADSRGVVLLDQDLHQHAGDRRRDLGVDLVGRDLEQRLVDGHLVAHILQPARHGAFGDGLAQRRHGHAFRHEFLISLCSRRPILIVATLSRIASHRLGRRSGMTVQGLAGQG